MNPILMDLKHSVVGLRTAVVNADLAQVETISRRIADLLHNLGRFSPDEMSTEDQQMIRGLMRIQSDTNQLLVCRLDNTKLAIEDMRRRHGLHQSWYA
ncbi:hypothetical protein [Alicyclobacillus mengziensis]|uniref:Uncharacterized protein n=1 Tax=Alicyclobacillus mengziensis TaxID=2931921 RepID=A0A9X7W029_9BACL|nr:hypothetical protein [Alicyclobacillus mengziensis]QSO48144.1 hypothetical protein JZ786_03810 [Alicyclobacillus mengziensis]